MLYPDCRTDTDEEQALIKDLCKYAKDCCAYYEGKIFSLTNWTKPLDNKMLMSGFYSGAFLPQAKMNNSNFSGAYFVDANLSGANLSYSCFRGTIFINANLMCADFTSANLRGANFIDANIAGAKLQNTDLSQAIGIRTVSPFGYHGESVYVVARSKALRVLSQSKDGKTKILRKVAREPLVYGYDFRYGYREPYTHGKKNKYNYVGGYPLSAAIRFLKKEYATRRTINDKMYKLDEWIEALTWAGKVADTVTW